ncbi:hypothetical protein [Notoacmeibacter sp. MSK16QG-6]|uniref:hypothetical protein n=1 Tax=Notoacmeibacter sp. MSK16QG-6 TaxID=2957982 RepID=UPI00209EB578|nr:hypothetical protein [Notoacmeibacter sp. MSK16QG-6]MCP1198780.1 hypothetical protein [Notoacmeibacter sp. MSK16QG-6]
MSETEREKIKLRSTYLNGVALIFLGLGGLGPAFTLIHSLNFFEWKNLVIALIWLWAGGMSSWELHEMAARNLDRLSEPK